MSMESHVPMQYIGANILYDITKNSGRCISISIRGGRVFVIHLRSSTKGGSVILLISVPVVAATGTYASRLDGGGRGNPMVCSFVPDAPILVVGHTVTKWSGRVLQTYNTHYVVR
jgi:hypothetical protein